MIAVLLLLGAISAFYAYLKWTYSYWTRNNVPGPEPRFFAGNIGSVVTMKTSLAAELEKWYKEYSDVPYFGFYKLMTPAIGVRDVELAKRVLIKDFASFPVPDFKISRKHDKLMAKHPFFLAGEDWQTERKIITPSFTSNKIKTVFPAMLKTCDIMMKYLRDLTPKKDVNAHEFAILFTMENTVRCGFSIDANCFSGDSIFLKARQGVFNTKSMWVTMKAAIRPVLPEWALDFIRIPFLSEESEDFFRKLVADNKSSRKPDQPVNDIFGSLLKSHTPNDENDDWLASRAMILYFEGSETSASSLAFSIYEVAHNPDVQDRLYAEVCEAFARNGGKLTYEALTEMTYLENVFLETLRLYPQGNLGRICKRSFTLPSIKNNPPVTIEPGTVVEIPVRALHLDPENFPEPEKFNPDRFDSAEVRNHPAYLPFGNGPRACLGTRFASIQVRTAIAMLVKNFRINLSRNHKPVVLASGSILQVKDGVLINFEHRN